MNVHEEHSNKRLDLHRSKRHPEGLKGHKHHAFIGFTIILSFCLLASIPLLAGINDAQAWEAAVIAEQLEGRAILAISDASQGVILLSQVDETLQSFGRGSNEGPEKPTPPPTKDTTNPTAGPSSISSVSDLQGCWSSDKAGTTMWTGHSQYFRHCFNKSGRTKSLTIMLDDRGKKLKQCRYSRKAIMEGNGFLLIDDSPPCPGWSSSAVHFCTLTSPGTASCTIKDNTGQTAVIMYYDAKLKP